MAKRKKKVTKSRKPKPKAKTQVKKRSSPKKQLRRKLTTDEYIVYRNKKGRIVKPRGGVFLTAEVRSKKTKKRVGYLNLVDKKTKKPIPRRYTATQRAFIAIKKPKKDVEAFRPVGNSWTFYVYSNKFLEEQIPTSLIRAIKRQIKLDDEVIISIEVGDRGTEYRRIDEVYALIEALEKRIAVMIYTALSDLGLRMSPKKVARQPKKKHVRKIKVTVTLRSIHG